MLLWLRLDPWTGNSTHCRAAQKRGKKIPRISFPLLYLFSWVPAHLPTAGSCTLARPGSSAPRAMRARRISAPSLALTPGPSLPRGSLPLLCTTAQWAQSLCLPASPMVTQCPKSHTVTNDRHPRRRRAVNLPSWPTSWGLAENLGPLRAWQSPVGGECANGPIKWNRLWGGLDFTLP